MRDQIGSSGAFGAVPLFTGTLLVSGSLGVAVPIGLMSAIYIAEYASARVRAVASYSRFWPCRRSCTDSLPSVGHHPRLRRSGGSPCRRKRARRRARHGRHDHPFVSLSDDVITAVPRR
jgi:hypothetical protein